MILIHKIIVIAALVYALSYPSYGRMGDVEKIKETINLYTKILIEESKKERHRDIRTFVNMMEDIATHDVARKLYLWIKAWQDSGLFMNAKVERFQFESVKIKGNVAEVITTERWIYNYFDKRIEKTVVPDTPIHYKVKYTLQKVKDKWLISKIKVIEEKQEKTNQEGKK